MRWEFGFDSLDWWKRKTRRGQLWVIKEIARTDQWERLDFVQRMLVLISCFVASLIVSVMGKRGKIWDGEPWNNMPSCGCQPMFTRVPTPTWPPERSFQRWPILTSKSGQNNFRMSLFSPFLTDFLGIGIIYPSSEIGPQPKGKAFSTLQTWQAFANGQIYVFNVSHFFASTCPRIFSSALCSSWHRILLNVIQIG